MPASLVSLRLRGIRSYSPLETDTQKIEFMPLTLILGTNGSGKTTIIEILKYMISGDEPPHSDSRRNFINATGKYDKLVNRNRPFASIELEFRNTRNQSCIARREIVRPVTKTATPQVTSCFKAGDANWMSINKKEDWASTLPLHFDLPNQALLNYVILCHQEENLWCLGDSSKVKEVFDKLFSCDQYKKEIKHMDAEIKICKQEIAMFEKDAYMHQKNLERIDKLKIEIKRLRQEISDVDFEVECFTSDLESLVEPKSSTEAEIVKMEREAREKEVQSRLDHSFQQLAQHKSEQLELSEKISSKLSKLSIAKANLVNSNQNYQSKIKNKESHIENLKDQIARTDPIAKGLASVSDNLGDMQKITRKMPKSDLVEDLERLVIDTDVIVKDLVKKVPRDSIDKLNTTIQRETDEIANFVSEIEKLKLEKVKLDEEYKTQEEEYNKVKLAAKDAHNKLNSARTKVTQVEDGPELVALRRKLADLQRKEMDLRNKRSMKSGAQDQMKRELKRLESELVTFGGTKIELARSIGKIECNKIILSDLERLKACFQTSITDYHDQMLTKINEVLAKRWRQIYRGADIDKIALIDEPTTRGDKIMHNYYIEMVKDGTRMKMKDKSSAGQRALASIILRITLAELFVRDFAFIALDEPTANLDSANIESLAKAIGSYVRYRNKKGANVQWLIITHDEKFIKTLDQECSPYYYRVQQGPDNNSRITKVVNQEEETSN